jgi:hypothetical protein
MIGATSFEKVTAALSLAVPEPVARSRPINNKLHMSPQFTMRFIRKPPSEVFLKVKKLKSG